MIVELHKDGGPMVAPIKFAGVSATKIRGNAGAVVAVAFELPDGGIAVLSADDPRFEGYCKQYGISTTPLDLVSSLSRGR
ncbi:MAG: hypothetical protein WC992_00285 [Acholeplasmataceae bacterium]